MNAPHEFSKSEADRILKRAAEIEGSESSAPMTADELRAIASEAGFGSQAVERAIAEAQQANLPQIRRNPVVKSGLILVTLSTVRTIPIQISSDQLMHAVRMFAPYRDGPAEVQFQEQRITWKDRKKIRFEVTSARGATEIHVFVSKPLLRRHRWMRWVKDAADRLESLVLLVAARDSDGAARKLTSGE